MYVIIDNEAGNTIEHAETLEQARQLIADHGTAPAALRFLLDFYRAKREDTSVHP